MKLQLYEQSSLDMFHDQNVSKESISFGGTMPKAPESIDATRMTEEQIHAKIQRGYESYKAGRTQNAAAAFDKFRESHS